MRDKKNATKFTRSIDRSHPANIRVIIPPGVDDALGSPEQVCFEIKGKKTVILSAISKKK